MPHSSKIFLKNRALGFVSNHVPCVTRYIPKRQETVIVTCVGKAIHTYGVNHLSLLTVSDTVDEDLTCLVAEEKRIYTASGCTLQSWERSSVVSSTFRGHSSPIHLLLPFGPFMISVDESNLLKVWVKTTREIQLEISFDIPTFRISALMHPSTYLNKILLGSEQGRMQIWNIKSSKLVHTFDGWDSPILVLEQAPALDVVGIGLMDGRILLHNLKYDETIVQFTQDWGPVSTISFRTDGPPILVTGTIIGHIVIWDLEEKKVASQILNAHTDTVSSAICLSNEPLMVTSSPDNSLKIWIFDQPDNGGRLLRKREGHSSQPGQVRFYTGNENHILSAGGDSSLRVFNVINESMNYSMGRARYKRVEGKKNKANSESLFMPPIAEFSVSTARAKEWDNIAATHSGIPTVTSWSYEKRRMGDHKLLPTRWADITRFTINICATCLHLTNCGNFVVIGYSSGHVDKFNIQSGIHRCSYGVTNAHEGIIQGVIVDALNQYVISGCNTGIVKFWPFKCKQGTIICPKPYGKLNVEHPISFFRSHQESSLIGVILDNFQINLIDIESRKVVRKFSGHTGPITDATFSPDARWIITSSADSSIRTWHIPTSTLIDMFKVDSPCISLSLSPTGQYLVTTHVENLGVYLWTNKTIFSHVSLQPIKGDEEVPCLSLPATVGGEVAIELDEEEHESGQQEEEKSPEQIGGLITLSGLASSRWANLLDLDLIRSRNKPKELPTAPQAAPFFLPTLPAFDIKFDLTSAPTEEDRVKTVSLDAFSSLTAFGKMLEHTATTGDYKPALAKLKEMGPSAINTEINALSLSEKTCSENLIKQFFHLIGYMFSTNRDFELAQSYLGLLLKIHGSLIAESQELLKSMNEIEELQQTSWNNIQNNIQYCLCIIEALKN